MRIEIRNDAVVIDGYVNAVARDSRPIPSVRGKFVEQIVPKAFDRALSKSKNVDLKRKTTIENDNVRFLLLFISYLSTLQNTKIARTIPAVV